MLTTGTKLGRYEIRSQLGAGGMGEVYLAQDTTELERTAAIKVLPPELAANKDRMQRFIQEAKTASSLNHPNILTIFEIGEADGMRFIATEFIDGETLGQRMARARLTLRESLDLSIQVASALVAAHKAGVVHRDIKPDNIMIRHDDGIVKVLDFGLAKPTERNLTSDTDTEAATKVLINTKPGMVMGTASYMSPEQARGLHADERTDIWSLGIVLYEMVTGRVPFEGATPTDVIASIVKSEPAPLSHNVPEAPAELERIVEKALAKNVDERYQTARDLWIDLRRLKQRLQLNAEIERTVPPEMRTGTTASGSGRMAGTISSGLPFSGATSAAPTTSSAEYIVNEIKRHKLAAFIALAVLALAVAGLAVYLHARNTEVAIDSIAVLPFENRSVDPDTDYLSDGLAESLIYRLSQLPNLRVSPTSSVFRYKGKETDPVKAGNELGVSAVLSGRIAQHGDQLTISAELVDVRHNKVLWGEQYDRKMSDLLATQREIAREITEKLKVKVSGEERGLAKHYTESNEAYQLYLKGRFYWNKRTAENLKKAIAQFQQAADKDPTYALAYVGLADCYALLEQYAGIPSSETLPKARAAALRALQIDNSLAEAHTSLGYINMHSWRFVEAEKELKRGIELNPNYPTAHLWYSSYLRVVGRLDESTAPVKRGQQLDPLSPIISVNVGNLYILKGDLNTAIEELKKVIEIDPNFPPAHDYLGWAYLKQGREQEAIAELQKAVEVSGRSSHELGFLGYGYGALRKRGEAMAVFRELEQRYARRESPAMYLAAVYAGLGEKDQAFAWLEKDFQARTGLLIFITWLPDYDTLRDDPRYTDLLRRMGIPS